jgi:RimJ/RimL family protein N-acetyltransferase
MVNIILRDVFEADLPVFFEQQLDPEACAMADFPSRDRETFMAHWTRIMIDESVILKTILVEESIAGNIVSWEHENEREVGYWLGREFWGKGIATQALTRFLALVKIRPLYAYVAKHNAASLRVLQKCKFAIQAENPEEAMIRLRAG